MINIIAIATCLTCIMVDCNKSIFGILPLQKILYKTQRILDKSQLQQEYDAYGGSESSTCTCIIQNTLNT